MSETETTNPAQLNAKTKAAAPFILVTVFLDMLSIGVIIPVLPNVIKGFLGGSVSNAGLWIGIFGSVWGLAQFIFSPIQGGLSDSLGRRPVVLASNFGVGVDFFFMALAPNLWWLFIGRIINGMTSASISTAYAYMSDTTEPHQRAKVFGLMGAAFGVGFVVGPSLGGVLGAAGEHMAFLTAHGWGDRLPFFFAGCLSLINFCYGFFVLPESLAKDKRRPFSFKTANPVGSIKFLMRSAQVLRLSTMYLLIMFAQSVFPTTMVLYAGFRFGWGPFQVGLMLGAVGVCTAIVQAGLTGMIVKKLGERRAMFLGLACGAIAFTGYAVASNWMVFVAFLPIGALWGLAAPNIQALMSSKVDPKEQGTLQGANMSLSSMSTIFAPMIFGLTLSAVTKPGMPVWSSAAGFALAALFLLFALWLGIGVRQSMKVETEFERQA